MLNNPDMAPSASINRWIVSILTFHFELVHVPGKVHGLDGLSRRPLQPGDISEEEDPEGFDDWVDNLYGFAHLLNPTLPAPNSVKLLTALAVEQFTYHPEGTDMTATNKPKIAYYNVPRSWAAVATDKRLEEVHDWLTFMKRPEDMPDITFTHVI